MHESMLRRNQILDSCPPALPTYIGWHPALDCSGVVGGARTRRSKPTTRCMEEGDVAALVWWTAPAPGSDVP